jgi:multiple sugar transport system substrate-binding protein
MSHNGESSRPSKSLTRRQFLKGAAALGLSLPALAACVPVTPAPATAPTAASAAAAPTSAPAAPGTTAIQYWDMVWGPPEYVDTGKKLIDQYNSSQSKVKVTYQSTPWANWYQTFLTAIGSGTAPDISTGAGYQAVYFYSQGAILPIDDVIADLKSAGKADDVVAGGIETLKWDNHYVAIPWNTDIRTFVYRKDLLEKAGIKAPPTSWDEFKAQAKQLTTAEQSGWVVQGNETGGTHILFMLMFNNNGGWFTPERKIDTFNERNVEAMQFFADMVKSGVVHKGSAGFTGDDGLKVLGQGGAVFYIAGPNTPGRVPNTAIGVPLAGPHGEKATISWINNRMIYKQSKNPAQAKELMKWLFDNEIALWNQGHCESLPTRKSFYNDKYFADKPWVQDVLTNWIPIGKPSGYRYPSIFPELQTVEGDSFMFTLLTDLLQGKAVKDSLNKVDSALKAIVKS